MEITIDCSKWRTGRWFEEATGKGETLLLNKEGYMCCLGFVTKYLRPDIDISGKCGPACCQTDIPYLTQKDDDELEYITTDLSEQAMGINDGPMSFEEKKRALSELFSTVGIYLKFEGEPVKGEIS